MADETSTSTSCTCADNKACTCSSTVKPTPIPPRPCPPPPPAPFVPPMPNYRPQPCPKPAKPPIAPFNPIYGKFDLTTYVQGASDYEIMAMLIQKYNELAAYVNSLSVKNFAVGGEHDVYDKPECAYSIEYTYDETQQIKYITVSNSKIYCSDQSILDLTGIAAYNRRIAFSNLSGLYVLTWNMREGHVQMKRISDNVYSADSCDCKCDCGGITFEDIILAAYDVYYAQGAPNVIEVWSSARAGETWDKLVQEIADRKAAIEQEIADRKAGDAAIQDNIDALVTDISDETKRAKEAEEKLQTAIDTEAEARAAADTKLQEAIDAEAKTRETEDEGIKLNLGIEEIRAKEAEKVLQANIDAEVTRATKAETTLQDNIDKEAAAREKADTKLQDNIDTEAHSRATADTNLQTNIDNEIAARKSADTTLQDSIDAEATARRSADKALQDNIDVEAAARKAADSSLQDSLTAEQTARIAEDNDLYNKINEETQDRIAAIDDVKNDVKSMQSSVDTLKTSVKANTDAIAEEVARAKAAEETLTADVEQASQMQLTGSYPYNSNKISTNANGDLIVEGEVTYFSKLNKEFTISAGTYTNTLGTLPVVYVESGSSSVVARAPAAVTSDDVIVAIIK